MVVILVLSLALRVEYLCCLARSSGYRCVGRGLEVLAWGRGSEVLVCCVLFRMLGSWRGVVG